MLRRCRIVWVLVLALLAGPAFALGLGQIEVLSKRDQPLLAEIPIISSDPAELEQLQARLASADTFARIGLDPPQGVVSNLRFEVALDRQGRPVIRVTSATPVQEQMLTFLVEVDWGQGRLVREYSALLDTPASVAAAAVPAIQAPVTAPSNAIVRASDDTLAQRIPADILARAAAPVDAAAVEAARAAATSAAVPGAVAADTAIAPDTAVTNTVAPAPASAAPPASAQALEASPVAPGTITMTPDAAATAAAVPAPAGPAPAPPAPAPAPPPPATAPSPLPTEVVDASQYGPLKRGETIGAIATTLAGDGYSRDQAMLALLRANPDAFIGGNINLVKQGSVLRVPPVDEITSLGGEAAAALVQEQIAQWRQARQPAPQPAALVGEPVARSAAAAAASGAQAAPRRTAARLEIVPPSPNGGRRAGTTSGIDAGGEGQMLRQELQQKNETLAARESEVQELKARVADLEKLQQQQQQLMTLKDSELAAAQQRLAASNAAQAAPVASAPAAGVEPAQSSAAPLLMGGAVLVLLALLATWWMRRSRRSQARTVFDTRALAEAMPPAVAAAEGDSTADASGDSGQPTAQDMPAAAPTFAAARLGDDAQPGAMAASAKPAAWNAGAAVMPTWHAAPASLTAEPAPAASPAAATSSAPAQLREANEEPAAGAERLELARAYIDLGDVDTARGLLQEVAASDDAGARGEASRLLRELA